MVGTHAHTHTRAHARARAHTRTHARTRIVRRERELIIAVNDRDNPPEPLITLYAYFIDFLFEEEGEVFAVSLAVISKARSASEGVPDIECIMYVCMCVCVCEC